MTTERTDKVSDGSQSTSAELQKVDVSFQYFSPQEGNEFDEKFHWELDENWTYDGHWSKHFPRHYTVTANENLSIAELYKKHASSQIDERFFVFDKAKKNYDAFKKESLSVSDEMSRSTLTERVFRENLKIDDPWKHYVKKELFDSFQLFETIVRPANGVVSDIFFEEGDWTADEMSKYLFKGKHAGYTFFKPFVFGEYRYKDALFRTSLDANKQDALYIENFQYTIDVPDIVDRGAAEVTDPHFNFTVKFNKHFHTAPEVTVTMRSGETGKSIIPNIVEITKTHFVMNLTQASDDQKTVGRFIWTAVGY